jgi:hypothetical protein
MSPENTLSGSQSHRNTYYRLHAYDMFGMGKVIETESRVVLMEKWETTVLN